MVLGCMMLFSSTNGFFLSMILVTASLYLSRIPPSMVWSTLKKFLWFYLFTGVFQLFLSPGTCILKVGTSCIITHEGLHNACLITGRFMLLVIISSLLTWSTSSIEITGALRDTFSVERFGTTARKVSIMTFLSLRFVPILFEEAERIKKTQQMRGITMREKNLLRRFAGFTSMATPLLFCLFKKANDLALAMESRCFFEDSEIKAPKLKLRKADKITLSFFLFCTVISLVS